MEVRTSDVAALPIRTMKMRTPIQAGGTSGMPLICLFPPNIKVTGTNIDERSPDGIRPPGTRSTIPRGVCRGGCFLEAVGRARSPRGSTSRRLSNSWSILGNASPPEARSRNIHLAISRCQGQETKHHNNTRGVAWVSAVNDPNIKTDRDDSTIRVEKETPPDSEGSGYLEAYAHGKPERPLHAAAMGGVRLWQVLRSEKVEDNKKGENKHGKDRKQT